ncbi:MAG: uracil-DNA glycosylase [Nitratireductor sp.]|nr:uracil-DNA glycosylase [Nitratireductor sp.]
MPPPSGAEPPRDCPACPRLVAFRDRWRAAEPSWHNAPVPSWTDPRGDAHVRLLIVGLAPGLRGANRTGRPFTGDYAGDLLYATLGKFGFATGNYAADPRDGLQLKGCAITNSVRCVPPENKPVGSEIGNCRAFLVPTMDRFERLEAVLTLGRIAHESTLRALGAKPAQAPFAHGASAAIGAVTVFSSYHCSRYNTNTNRLTPGMFEAVFAAIAAKLDGKSGDG